MNRIFAALTLAVACSPVAHVGKDLARPDEGVPDMPPVMIDAAIDAFVNVCAGKPAGTPCRPAADICDVAESCTGTSDLCPPDQVQPTTFTCRDGTASCNPREGCDGVHVACPPDINTCP